MSQIETCLVDLMGISDDFRQGMILYNRETYQIMSNQNNLVKNKFYVMNGNVLTPESSHNLFFIFVWITDDDKVIFFTTEDLNLLCKNALYKTIHLTKILSGKTREEIVTYLMIRKL